MSDSTPQSVENATTSDTGAAAEAMSSVVCPPAKDPGVRLLIAAGLLLAMGIYCIIDVARGAYPYVPFSMEEINAFGKWAFNFFGQFVLTIPGVVLVVWGILFFRRPCVADEQGLHYAYFKKKPVAWDEIEKIDASKLKADRILVVHAKDGREIKLDSWKLENFKSLVVFIEQHVPAEKIKA
jgi:hypothetical protein